MQTTLPSPVDDNSSGDSVLYSTDEGVMSADLGTGVGAAGATSLTSTATNSPLVINVSWDTSVSNAPASFKTAVTAAAQYLEGLFTDPVTINISVGFGEVGGTALPGTALGMSSTFLDNYSYAPLRSALAADAKTSTDASLMASLPVTLPVNGAFWVSSAESKALAGLIRGP